MNNLTNKIRKKKFYQRKTSVSKNLVKYRDYILVENIQKYEFIGFYPREFFCFDNFSSFAIVYKGTKYLTVEHAYQAMKFVDTAPEIAKKIVESNSAVEAKIIARRNADKQNKDWTKISAQVMEELLRAKIAQHEYVKTKLLETKDMLICEDSPTDSFWGIGPNRDGENMLGKIWMKLRDELIASEK